MTANFNNLPQAWIDQLHVLMEEKRYGFILTLMKQYGVIPRDAMCSCTASYQQVKELIDGYLGTSQPD